MTLKARIHKFAQEKQFDPTSMEANYGFLKQELETSNGVVVSLLKAKTSKNHAVTAFANNTPPPLHLQSVGAIAHAKYFSHIVFLNRSCGS